MGLVSGTAIQPSGHASLAEFGLGASPFRLASLVCQDPVTRAVNRDGPSLDAGPGVAALGT
ncbi:hypothetical protein GCM10025762_10030 [Haloechinothrix salitolerans]